MSKLQKVFSSFGFLIILIMMFVCLLFGCERSIENEKLEEPKQVQEEKQTTHEETDSEKEARQQAEEQQKEETPVFDGNVSIGEKLYLYDENNNVTAEVVITNAQWTDYRNEFTDADLDKEVVSVLEIDWEYTNVDVKDWNDESTEWMFSEFDFDVYDNNNRKLQSYPTDNYGDGLVSKGRTGVGSANFVVFDDCKHFEVEIDGLTLNIDLE